jgi:hypothetical protein
MPRPDEEVNAEERIAVCRLTRTVSKLIDLAQARNAAEWQLLHQARIDVACVEKALGTKYCDDVPEESL